MVGSLRDETPFHYPHFANITYYFFTVPLETLRWTIVEGLYC